MEHRCGYRRTVDVSVIIRSQAGLTGKGRICEVSASGARLISALPLTLESTVLVQFSVRLDTGRTDRRSLAAEVVRQTEDGFGLEWTEFAPEAVRVLYAPAVDFASSPPRVPARYGRMRRR